MMEQAVKILAVVVGGLGGGLGLGLLAQLLLRAMGIRKPPRWPIHGVRLLGGALCGWLVALLLFGGGGWGFGGAGGWGLGTGSGQGQGEKTEEINTQDSEENASAAMPQRRAGATLRIEVLGRAALPDAAIQQERWYRLETAEGPRLLTFAEIKEAIKQRQQEQPPLRRIEIVLYKDSPDERVPLVSQLRIWAADRNDGKMRVDITEPDADAPR